MQCKYKSVVHGSANFLQSHLRSSLKTQLQAHTMQENPMCYGLSHKLPSVPVQGSKDEYGIRPLCGHLHFQFACRVENSCCEVATAPPAHTGVEALLPTSSTPQFNQKKPASDIGLGQLTHP